MLVNIVPRNYINFILKRGKQDGRIEKEDGRISWILHLVRVITHARTHAHSIISPLFPFTSNDDRFNERFDKIGDP